MAGFDRGAVFWALLGNGALTVTKFAAFVLSGSGAMMSEAIHSFADTTNQALLYVGIRRSQRPADEEFAYGYGADRYVFSLLAAVGIFFLGCGVTVYHGIHSLLHPRELTLSWITFSVLAIALVVDGAVLLTAAKEVVRRKRDQGFFDFVRTSTDPTLLAVLFEDGAATLGVLIATTGIVLSYVSGSAVYDALSSIAIGVMMGVLALWLGLRNRALILGPSIPPEIEKSVLDYLGAQPSVASVVRLRTRVMAANRFRIAADLDYDGVHLGQVHAEWMAEQLDGVLDPADARRLAEDFGDRVIESLASEIDRIEAELVERFPRILDIDLESD